MTAKSSSLFSRIPLGVSALIPLLALIVLLSVFAFADPLAVFKADLPPVEQLTFEQIRVVEGGFELTLLNGGSDPIHVAQVLIDEAYWEFDISPSPVISRLGRAHVSVPYPWVETESHEIRIITETGVTFDGTVEIAVATPIPGLVQFGAYGLLGVYVGIIPVVLGMLWYPAMSRLDRKWLGGILALTMGLLVFLLIDTLLEAFELAETLPGVFQGIPLAIFAGLFIWFILLAVRSTSPTPRARGGMRLAGLIALGIGLHNLGEGLAIGAAFALGEAALGSFLVIGFTLHNVTEGIGIAAPLLPDVPNGDSDQAAAPRPKIGNFVLLALLAGSPAIFGAWLGGFAFSPLLATIFLGIGAGAIWQVIAEVAGLLQDYARRREQHVITWINVAGFMAGLLVMYLTAFLVSF
jgi:zinc transporter ZupT